MFRSTHFHPLLLTFSCALALGACSNSTPPVESASSSIAATADASQYKPAATFQEIMDSVVDKSSDYVWEAVSFTSDAKGTHEHQPHTDQEWHEFRRNAVALVEAANLIVVPGRRVANGDKTVENGEALPVAAIQQRLDSNHVALVGFANALREVSLKLVEAADKRDVDSITNIGGELDEACEACHKVFWYPDDPAPANTTAAK